MTQRFKITRNPEQLDNLSQEHIITLEECKVYFASQPDFQYTNTYIIKNEEATMTIEGEFFMWQISGTQVPFRLFDGEIYVAVSHEIIFNKMIEIAEQLQAYYIEG